MADSIQPWIASYLIDIAEKYGADMQSIPTCQKRKKVQLTEASKLTYHLTTPNLHAFSG
jgi:hypothetical protein